MSVCCILSKKWYNDLISQNKIAMKKKILVGTLFFIGMCGLFTQARAESENKFTLPFLKSDQVVMIEGRDYNRDDCDKKPTLAERDKCIFDYPDFDSEHYPRHTHEGFDYAREDGLPFIARSVADHGVVTRVSNTGYTSGMTVQYEINGKKVSASYAHVVPSVKKGDRVDRGDPLGWTYETQSAFYVPENPRGGYCRPSERPRRVGTTIYDKTKKICFHAHIHFNIYEEGVMVDPYGMCVNKPRYACTSEMYDNFMEKGGTDRIWIVGGDGILSPDEISDKPFEVIPKFVWGESGKIRQFKDFSELASYWFKPYLDAEKYFGAFGVVDFFRI